MMTKRKKAQSPYADKRGSKVHPDLDDAMKGKGGKRPAAKKKAVKKKKVKYRPKTLKSRRIDRIIAGEPPVKR